MNDVEVKEQATRAFGALAALNPAFATLIYGLPECVPGSLAELVHVDGELLLQSAALLALAQITEGFADRFSAFKNARIPRRITQLLRAPVERVQRDAAHAVKVLARAQATKRDVVGTLYEALVVGPLCDLVTNGLSDGAGTF